MYYCGPETETTSRFSSFFFLRCQLIVNERQKLHDDVYRIDASINFLAVFLSFMNQIFFE